MNNIEQESLYDNNKKEFSFFLDIKKKNKLSIKRNHIRKKHSFFIIFIIFIFIFILLLSYIYLLPKRIFEKFKLFNHKDVINDKKSINKSNITSIHLEENFPPMKEAFDKAKVFLNYCLKGILINDYKLKSIKYPKVSAIITLYNCQSTISRAIKSIQNQNMPNIEIILINDFSTDNTISIVEEIGKLDPRIKIMNNKKNMGTYFSRSIGTLYSNGKYIFHLDSDDMYLDKDVFSITTDIGDEGDFDIISFRGIWASRYNILSKRISDIILPGYKDKQVQYQPELGLFPFRPGKNLGNYIPIDSNIWLKCVKTKIYKKMLQKVGKERYSRYMVLEEDRTDIFALFNTAESNKFIGKYNYLHIPTNGSSTSGQHSKKEDILYRIYFLDICIDFTKDTLESNKLLVYIITFIMDCPELKEIMISNDYNKKLFISCMLKILNNRYISKVYKLEIRKRALKFEFLRASVQF